MTTIYLDRTKAREKREAYIVMLMFFDSLLAVGLLVELIGKGII